MIDAGGGVCVTTFKLSHQCCQKSNIKNKKSNNSSNF